MRQNPILAIFYTVIAMLPVILSAKACALNLMALTWDNDLLVGEDSGYTNGLYLSYYRVGGNEELPSPSGLIRRDDATPQPGILLKPLAWLLPEESANFAVDAYSFGQVMITPEDLTISPPDSNDLPYAGKLSLTNTYVAAKKNHADSLAISVGIIGPDSMADQAQKSIHDLTGSEAPAGWEYQVENKFVFQISRGKIWRKWLSESQSMSSDLVIDLGLNLGTVERNLSSAAVFRIGNDLNHTYISPAFNATRTNNPISVEGGGFFYLGVTASYIDYQYLIEGNTPLGNNTQLDHSQYGIQTGITYSWKYLALSLAIEEFLLEGDTNDASRYGTLTIAWRI